MQVNDSLEPYAHALDVSLRLVAGGLSMSRQIQALDRGVHLLVATPGRLADLARQGHADLSRVQITALDEADHMAQMGFMEEITEILSETPSDGQRLLFSATLDGDVEQLIKRWMHDPVTHDVTGGDEPVRMEHIALNIPPNAKYQLATRIANREGRTIAFVRTKLAADRIAEDMRANGVLAVALHGDKPQAERTAAITGFRAGQIPVLVATDVAARGIHVDHVDLVLQIDPPADPKDYTHRSGRTARAGAEGLVVTLVLPHQRRSTDRMFETANVEPTFRKVRGEDAESLELIDRLTGASQPSGVPVQAPRLRARPERPQRGGGQRGGGQWGGGQRSHGDYGRPPRRESTERFDELARREADLAARERALAEREQALATREVDVDRRQSRPARDDSQRSYEKKPYEKKPYEKKPYEKKPYAKKPYGKQSNSSDGAPRQGGQASGGKKPYGAKGGKPYQGPKSAGGGSQGSKPRKPRSH
jgi:superfamily II DNA/RNA helicase